VDIGAAQTKSLRNRIADTARSTDHQHRFSREINIVQGSNLRGRVI
jgi:hypothetical protein